MTTAELEKKTIDARQVQEGDLMAFIYFTEVKRTNYDGSELAVADLDNNEELIHVRGETLVERSYSADWYDSETKDSKTNVAELLTKSFNRPFTVCFEKQDGAERTLRGRLVKPEPILGRSMVEDLDVDQNSHRLRQVDHRTIKWLIVDGTKHVVK